MRWCLNKINSADDNKLNPTNFYFYRHSKIKEKKKKKRRRTKKEEKKKKEKEEEEEEEGRRKKKKRRIKKKKKKNSDEIALRILQKIVVSSYRYRSGVTPPFFFK